MPFSLARAVRWGVIGGVALSLTLLVKVAIAFARGSLGGAPMSELFRDAAIMLSIGFVCGFVACAVTGLHRFGMAGDAVAGVVVMVLFFTMCMLVFDPALLFQRFRAGALPMYAMGTVLGAVAGAWFGRDFRKENEGEMDLDGFWKVIESARMARTPDERDWSSSGRNRHGSRMLVIEAVIGI